MPEDINLVTTVSPDGAGLPPTGVQNSVEQLLLEQDNVWAVFLVNVLTGVRWGFYRGNGRWPSDYQSHDLQNPGLCVGIAADLAIIMINHSLPNDTYSMYVTDATQNHSVQYSSLVYEAYTSSSSSE